MIGTGWSGSYHACLPYPDKLRRFWRWLILSGCTGGAFVPRGDGPGATVETAPSRDISISGIITQEPPTGFWMNWKRCPVPW